MRKDILYIKDIVDNEGNILDHIAINTKYNSSLTFLDSLKIRLTIPHDWKDMLKDKIPENKENDLMYLKLNNLKTLKTKYLYSLLLEKEHDLESPVNAHLYWQDRYKLDEKEMSLVHTLPYRATKLTTLQALQYKIINKIINCNYWLYKLQILEAPNCRFCQKVETIEHFFFDCELTKQFWYAFLTWWNTVENDHIKQLDEKDIVLGYNIADKKKVLINCCILIGKKVIYEQKKYIKQQPDIYKFHCELKTVIEIDKQICTKNDKLGDFYSFWINLVSL
jgi:hypothetical protein